MNSKEAMQKAIAAADQGLKSKGFISMVDVLMTMGKLTREDHERWRCRQVPYLEKVVSGNLSQLDAIVRAVRNNSLKGGLRPSHTAYVSWGKGPRQPLRFTKTGNPFLEKAYSTHYLAAKEVVADFHAVQDGQAGADVECDHEL
jgi:hypothetical protein